MRVTMFGYLLFVMAMGGCAAQYQAPDGKPVAELQFQSETMPKRGLSKGIITMDLHDLAPEGVKSPPRLGYVIVWGDELDRVLRIEADRVLQFKPTVIHQGFHCHAPFKAKLEQGSSYVLNMNIDTGLRECEIELLDVSVNPVRLVGRSRESSAHMSTYSNGMTTTTRTINPARPPSNPHFE